ncbi:hypothetical protein [Rhodothalassium salexigens]|uniref:hypothetical protein n=1 Tax=Rhodothalassium salexigens TaxID=1086 RepID=UPI001A91B82F|nr:hypothetical protein [Rhodothalassium salexigens]
MADHPRPAEDLQLPIKAEKPLTLHHCNKINALGVLPIFWARRYDAMVTAVLHLVHRIFPHTYPQRAGITPGGMILTPDASDERDAEG